MTRWAWWPHTTDHRVASYRLRCLQIVQALQTQGCEAAVYRAGGAAPDVLVLSKRYDQSSLDTARELRARHGTRVVLDLCDNHFHFNDDPEGRLARRAALLRQACGSADLVIVASDALGTIVQLEVPSARLAVIPDAAEPPLPLRGTHLCRHPVLAWQLRRLRQRLAAIPPERRLVWFGSHGSPGVDGGVRDLEGLAGRLEAAYRDAPLSLTVISNSEAAFLETVGRWRLPTVYLPWAPVTFSAVLRLHSAALIPVRANPFTVCKTANRVLTATLHGLNVIADAIPSYEPFRDAAVLDDWNEGLGAYLRDDDRRRDTWQRALDIATRDYSLDRTTKQWRQHLSALGSIHSPDRVPLASS